MSYNPDTRKQALDAALQIHRSHGSGMAIDVIKSAREIEAYLNGDDSKASGPLGGATLGGNVGQILPGQNFASHGRAQ